MHRHPHFAFWLHDDAELGALLGSPVVERTTLHEWPLSCVHLLRLADGRARVYKAHGEPTLEPAFYARARSPLLIEVRALEHPNGPPALLLERLEAPTLADQALDEPAALRAVDEVLEGIAAIEGEPPVMWDVRAEAWGAYATALLDDLRVSLAEGRLPSVGRDGVEAIRRACEAGDVFAAVQLEPGLVNGDLQPGHVFLLPDGLRVIDWQRPILGPVAIDRAMLLRELGVDPRRHVPGGVLRLIDLLLAGWYAGAVRRWLAHDPGVVGYLDREIARLATGLAAA